MPSGLVGSYLRRQLYQCFCSHWHCGVAHARRGRYCPQSIKDTIAGKWATDRNTVPLRRGFLKVLEQAEWNTIVLTETAI